MPEMSVPRLAALADELAVTAQNGLVWSRDRYDRERFGRVLAIAAELLASTLPHDIDVVTRWYTDEPGWVTSKVGAAVAVFDGDGRLLLIQRNDNARWAMPGGVVEYGESVAHAATREAREESGVESEIRALLGIYNARQHGFGTIYHWQHVVFLADAVAGTPGPSDETLAAGFFTADDAAQLPISPGHADPIRDAFAAYGTPVIAARFDP